MTQDPDSVATKAEFLQFLEDLREDLARNPDDWENPTLERYLEAMTAWVQASDGFYRNLGRSIPGNISWRFFAEALAAARIYE